MNAVSEDAVVGTIASIYDAALSADAWPRVLEGLAQLFACHFVDLFTRSHDRRQYAGLAHGLDRSDYQDLFLDTWFKRNVWGLSRPTQVEGEILTTRDMLDPAVLRRSEIYADYLEPRDLHEGLRLSLWADRDGVQDMSLLRPWAAGPYTSSELELAARLLPHLQRATAITRRLARQEATSAAGLMGLDAAGLGTILLDGAGRAMLLNGIADRLVAARDGLIMQDKEIRAASHRAGAALRQALARALDESPLERTSSTIRVSRTEPHDPLVVVVLPLFGTAAWCLPQRPAALLLISDPAAPGRSTAQLAGLFGLTTAEAELAASLDAGMDIRQIAREQGRSVHTVRNHLARVMSKTDTTTQAELARLLRSIPDDSRLRSRPAP